MNICSETIISNYSSDVNFIRIFIRIKTWTDSEQANFCIVFRLEGVESICKQIDKEKVIICHRIASFLRLVLTQIPGTVFHCYLRNALVQRFLNPRIQSAWYLYQCKAEEGGDAVASLTDDNAVMMQITWYIICPPIHKIYFNYL